MRGIMKKNRKGFCEPEIHAYIDSLCASQFYGKLTFFFQDGNIESCRTESVLAKKDIISKQRAVPSTKKIRICSCKQVSGTPHKIVHIPK